MPLIHTAAAPVTHPEPGMVRQLLAHNPHLMLVLHTLDAGWAGAAHSHPHHQVLYVLSGRIRLLVDGEEFFADTGDSIAIDGNITHRAFALEPTQILDIFTPAREDYKPASQQP
jgi:quercetin dioxygenase-like cupin family protein